MKKSDKKPNEETLRAMKDAKENRNLTEIEDLESFFNSIINEEE